MKTNTIFLKSKQMVFIKSYDETFAENYFVCVPREDVLTLR